MRRGDKTPVFALALAIALAAGGARAQSPAELREARELFAAAEKDERASDWSAALEKLRRVAQIKVTPGVRFHLALAEEKTGQLVAALSDYAQAEKQATDEKNHEVLAALKDPIAALQARVPRLVVKVPPDVKGVEVTLDGKPLAPGLYSAEIPVDAKSHTIDAKAPGRRAFSRTVAAAERESTTIDVVLDEEKKPGAAPTPIPTAPTSTGPNTAPPPPPPETPRAGGAKTTAVLATAGALALVGGGVAAYLIADGKQSDGRDQCKTVTTPTCDDPRGAIRTWDALALGAWVGAGALGALAVILWVTPAPSAPKSARVFVGPGSAGVAGSF